MDKVSKAIDFLVEEDPLFSNPMVFDDKWLDEHVKGSWKRRPDGKIDVEGSLRITRIKGLTALPYSFGKVSESFYCYNNLLTSLAGAPERVGHEFNCSYNSLESLEGSPEYVRGDFDCSFNNILSLKGVAKVIKGNFNCSYNLLTTLKDGPDEVKLYYIAHNNPLESLEGVTDKIGEKFSSTQFTDADYRAYVKEHY